MKEVSIAVESGFDWFVVGYFLVLSTMYLALILLASRELLRYFRRRPFIGHDEVFDHPLAPPISVIMPAHNEEVFIVDAARAMLGLHYPELEVIVVDDGSTDATFERLQHAFDLVQVPLVMPPLVPTLGDVHSTHLPRGHEPLVVVRKESVGSKADALNAGIRAAHYPLLCMVDADAILDPDALLLMARPFVEDPHMVAAGGSIRAVNDSTVYRGQLIEARIPRRWLPRIQVVEYLRAFLLGRTGWAKLGCLLVISGAFGVFRRDVVIEVGGYDADAIGEDADLVARIHRLLLRQRRRYSMAFVSEPVCWTEVPETREVLGRQRGRWSQGLFQVLWTYRGMIFNPRYGRIGLVVLPYFLLFELLGPVVELLGLLSVTVGLALGLINVPFAVLFFLVAFGYGILLSWISIAIEEFSYHRYPQWRDLAWAVAAAVVENVGYRQLHDWWRIKGIWHGARRRQPVWGVMHRVGFTPERTPEAKPEPVTPPSR